MFFLNKIVDDKDHWWFDSKIEILIHEKIKSKKILTKYNRNTLILEKLKMLQNG